MQSYAFSKDSGTKQLPVRACAVCPCLPWDVGFLTSEWLTGDPTRRGSAHLIARAVSLPRGTAPDSVVGDFTEASHLSLLMSASAEGDGGGSICPVFANDSNS